MTPGIRGAVVLLHLVLLFGAFWISSRGQTLLRSNVAQVVR